MMSFLDQNENVLEWSSEEVVVPYVSPKDGRHHRYYPDFLAKMMKEDGSIKTVMIEVKPKKETKEPRKQSKVTQKYITEVVTWGINQAKWKAAQEYCADRQWDFMIITEEHLGIK